MDAGKRSEIVSRLSAAFGGAQDMTPAEDQPLHVLLPQLELPDPWKPSPTRGLTVWRNWPNGRPEFVVDESVVGKNGEPPRSHSQVYLLGKSWRGFSFEFPWKGDDPVRVIQLWMARFIVEQT
jgi:hypothetical protein